MATAAVSGAGAGFRHIGVLHKLTHGKWGAGAPSWKKRVFTLTSEGILAIHEVRAKSG